MAYVDKCNSDTVPDEVNGFVVTIWHGVSGKHQSCADGNNSNSCFQLVWAASGGCFGRVIDSKLKRSIVGV